MAFLIDKISLWKYAQEELGASSLPDFPEDKIVIAKNGETWPFHLFIMRLLRPFRARNDNITYS